MRASEWPTTYVSILVCSRPQCAGSEPVSGGDIVASAIGNVNQAKTQKQTTEKQSQAPKVNKPPPPSTLPIAISQPSANLSVSHPPSSSSPPNDTLTTSTPRPTSHFKFHCTVCSFGTARKSHFDRHVAFHQANPDLTIHKCLQCEYSSTRISRLQHHVAIHHTADAQAICCDRCPYKTRDEKLLRKHQRLVHDSAAAQLRKKRQTLKKEVAAASGAKTGKTITSSKDTPKGPFACPKCAYRSKSFFYYVRHLRRHSTEPLASKVSKKELLNPGEMALVAEFQCSKVSDRGIHIVYCAYCYTP